VTIQIHGDHVADHRKRALARAPDRIGSMRRPSDPVEVANAARVLLQSGRWRSWGIARSQL
jgi:hypothetical protein